LSSEMLSHRLDELVADANRFRTKACGMNSMLDRGARERRSGNPKIPGSTVTQEGIDDQRRERKLRQKKPPVPKANTRRDNS
jgi:hypothetical protein